MVWPTSFWATLPPPLEREVTISLQNEPIVTALQKIQAQTDLVFSYQSSVISKVQPITIQLKQKTVREALALIFNGTIVYKVRGHYIILKEKPPSTKQSDIQVSGYVYDKSSQKKLANVTVYDKATLKSVTTNEYGYYSITVPAEQQCIKVNKENYKDTCVPVIPLVNAELVNIPLDVHRDSLGQPDTLFWRKRIREMGINTRALFGQLKGYVNTLNVRDTFMRPFQISFLPFLGTNGKMSGNVYNYYSINVLGGFSRGTNGLEVATLFNVSRERMLGAQLAGMINVVGDTAKGVQLSGLINLTGRLMDGVQGAGLMNINVGGMRGVQMGGVMNTNIGRVEGVILSGFLNVNTSDVKGVQLTGLMNVNAADASGVLVAGMLNVVSDTLKGVAVAGLLNITNHTDKTLQLAGAANLNFNGRQHVQVSSLLNTSMQGTTKLQIAGLMNVASHITKAQIGLFNYADTASGVPIGLFSVVRKGLHQLELACDEMIPINMSFRTGVPAFFNILTAGVGVGSDRMLWQFGYGLGTSIKINKRLRMEVNATAHHLSVGSLYTGVSERYMAYGGLEYSIAKNMKLSIGPTFNMYIADAFLPDYINIYRQLAPGFASERNLANGYNLKNWIGFKAAIRFF